MAMNKKTIQFLAIVIAMVFILNFLLIPVYEARAQFVVTDPITGQATTIKNIKDFITKLLVGVAGVAVINAADYFAQKLAYDAAVALATGGKGEMPLFSSKGWGDYFRDVSLNAVGEFVGSLSEGFEDLDLCNPGPAGVRLKIQTGLADPYIPVGRGPEPKCEWNDIQENWDEFTEDFSSGEVLERSGVLFQPGQSPLSVSLEAGRQLSIDIYELERIKELERLEGEGFFAKTGIISGEVLTPAQVIAEKGKQLATEGEESQRSNVQAMGQALSAGATQILASALGTFVNTLAGTLMERIFDQGLFSLRRGGGSSGELINPEFSLVGTREIAQDIFSDFIKPPIKTTETYDLVTDFSVCPSQFMNQNNCVIDNGFAEAVRREQAGSALSVKEAIDQGLLHGEWPLISSFDRARNTDIYCYTYGYCQSNLVKLRQARIIPIGWEIAAEKSGTSTGQATLREVMNGFHDCAIDDEGRPIADSDHPWCHLIDPNWVIKYPLTQCRALVSGPTLLTSENSLRNETCVDAPSCISVDEEGNCIGGWGYCTREKNTWHFGGDSCPEIYESCRTFTDSSGFEASYLLNTTNQGICTEDNAGCRWYAREKFGDDWTAVTAYDTDTKTLIATEGAIYFNGNVEECSASDGGCTEMIRASEAGVTVNLIGNPSFEVEDPILPGMPEGWERTTLTGGTSTGTVTLDLTGDHSVEGGGAVMVGPQTLGYYVTLSPSRFYTFSLYARAATTATDVLDAGIQIFQPGGADADMDPYYIAGINCSRADRNANGINEAVTLKDPARTVGVVVPDEFTRYECTLTTPRDEDSYTGHFFIRADEGNVWVDAVQLEESEFATDFHEGIGIGGDTVFLKRPPNYLNCDDPTLASDDCGDYLRMCSPLDVGCKLFYPDAGGSAIAGKITPEDFCPAECVGYETFREEPTQWTAAAKFPLYFIPTTARECSASVVGCEEFTNLDTVEEGGETRSYFTDIRTCEKPAEDSETFYTWEGSDTTGFQLKTWVLKGSNTDDGPCTTLDTDQECNDPTPGTTAYAERDCSADFGIDADCREFYNTAGDIFYRNYSETIVVTEDCHRFRKTEVTGETDCTGTGGIWTDAGECIYMGYAAESQRCGAESAGCRAYTGPTSRNIEEEFSDDFEAGSVGAWGGGTISTESVLLDGQSMKVLSGGRAFKGWPIEAEETYVLSFWAKGQGDITVSIGSASGTDLGVDVGTVTISSEWNEYNIGPIRLETVPTSPEIIFRGFTRDSYLDNITLLRVSEHLYLIRDSWYTPISCDMNNQGVYLPQAQLGCEGYTDNLGLSYYLKSFERLCTEDAVGCEGFINTFNSVSTAEEVFNEGEGGAEVIVPGDKVEYYVYDETHACSEEAKGCEAFGQPVLAQDGRSVNVYADIYLINNPQTYSSTLCTTDAAYCDEFISDGAKYYFKSPEGKTCEFREKVKIAGIEYSGWFRSGVDTPCYPAFLSGGNIYGIWRNGDENYDAWYGICPAEYHTCTQFLDPADVSYENPEGQPYYYLNNDALDKSCTTISKREGCALFDNTVASTKLYNSWATYLESEDNNFEGVSPIDCRSSDSIYCSQVCRYQDHADNYFTHSCRSNDNCGRGETCQDITVLTNSCRRWEADDNTYVYSGTCTTNDDCPSGRECVDMQRELRRNDTNEILRVQRDRECGEWLSCRSSVSVWDENTAQYINICTDHGLCNEYVAIGDSTECNNFIESEHTDDVLTESNYVIRNVDWEGMDYSGYSIPRYYSVDELQPVDLSVLTGSTVPDLRLAFISDDSCSTFWEPCGEENSLGNRGVCLTNGQCVYAINGESLPSATSDAALYDALNTPENQFRVVSESCRAYPEESSPFPSKVANWEDGRVTSIDPNFKRANICEEAVWTDLNGDGVRDEDEVTYQDCECSYQKATYGSSVVTQYFSPNETNIPSGICSGGPRANEPCVSGVDYDEDLPSDSEHNLKTCGSIRSGGTCQTLERTDSFVGWYGQCLEYDLRTTLNGDPNDFACNIWYPSYILPGGQDIYNIYGTAGYNPTSTGRYWCLLAQGLRSMPEVGGMGDNYEARTRKNSKIVKARRENSREYREKFYIANEKEKLYKDDLIAIELIAKSAQSGDWPNGRNTDTEDFYEDGGNILSRLHEVPMDYGYTAWEVFWNIPDDLEIPSSAPPVFTDPNIVYEGVSRDEDVNSGDGTCDNDYPGDNYFAIRAVFDNHDQFVGYWTSTCDDSSSSGWVKFDTIFHTSESCLVVAQAQDEDGLNKAFTSRLYPDSNFAMTVGSEYFYEQTFAPFGSAMSFEPPVTPTARDVEVYPWIVGDNGEEESHIGVPNLTWIPEEYTLAGSSLGCQGTCGDETLEDLNFQPSINRPLDNLKQLFTKVYNLYAWYPGQDKYQCIPTTGWSGDVQFYLPCSEDDDCRNPGSPSCATSTACNKGPFKGDRSCGSDIYCEGEAATCGDVTEEGETEKVCSNSFRGGALCDNATVDPPTSGDYIVLDTGATINVPSGENDRGADYCNATGYCINWAAHSGGDITNRCYGGINHGEPCATNDFCNNSLVANVSCERGLCQGGLYEVLNLRTSCTSDGDCRVDDAGCEVESVLRCDGGLLDGAVCGGEYGNNCAADFSCELGETSGVSIRGFVTKGCDANPNFPCTESSDCEVGTCQYLSESYFDFGAVIDEDDARDVGKPPTIAAIDFTKCDQVTGTCRVARTNGFDVNNWYYGVLSGEGQLKTTVRFYAWAAHDQMPITSRTVDWGDGSPFDQTTASKYKNQKPYCGTAIKECDLYEGLTCRSSFDCPAGTGTCVDVAPSFGNDPGACDQGYFQFEHTYICNRDSELPSCSFSTEPGGYSDVPANGCQTATGCFFRPRVQVLDNWGWCNGDCFGAGGGCYNSGVEYCDPEDDGYPHWTSFDGYIKVNK